MLANDPADVLGSSSIPTSRVAVPTPDHFIPLLYFAGLVAAAGTTAQPFVDGCALGSLSMTSYALDCSTGVTDESPATPTSPHPRPCLSNQHVTTPHIWAEVCDVGHRSYAGVSVDGYGLTNQQLSSTRCVFFIRQGPDELVVVVAAAGAGLRVRESASG